MPKGKSASGGGGASKGGGKSKGGKGGKFMWVAQLQAKKRACMVTKVDILKLMKTPRTNNTSWRCRGFRFRRWWRRQGQEVWRWHSCKSETYTLRETLQNDGGIRKAQGGTEVQRSGHCLQWRQSSARSRLLQALKKSQLCFSFSARILLYPVLSSQDWLLHADTTICSIK